jgi:glycosyltransferase involved in cell wall biosynthesis
MSRTKNSQSKTNKNQSKQSKTQSKKSKKQSKTKKTQSKIFTARIIIKDNIGGIVADKDTIKEIIEKCGGKVEVVIYNDIKTKLQTKSQSHLFKKVSIQIFIEHISLEYPLKTFPADKSYIFINQEYIQDWDIARMKDKTIIPLCKTQESIKTLTHLGITSAKYVGFGNNNQFNHSDKIEKLPNLFIHIVGSSPLKGTKTLINTWIYKNIQHPLIITGNDKTGGNTNLFKYWKSLSPKIKPLPIIILNKWEEWINITNANTNDNTNANTNSNTKLPQFEKLGSIYFCNTIVEYNVIQFLQSIADVHMCPSLIEGWGQYIDEGRRSKSVVVTLDAPPMNELIKDGKTGILVKASKGPSMRQLLPIGWTQYFTKDKIYNKFLYGTYKTTINDLYNSINRILNMTPEQKQKIGNNAHQQSLHDYTNFKKLFSKVIL